MPDFCGLLFSDSDTEGFDECWDTKKTVDDTLTDRNLVETKF